MVATFEGKQERYAELAAAYSEAGWRAFTFPLEVGCRGSVGYVADDPAAGRQAQLEVCQTEMPSRWTHLC